MTAQTKDFERHRSLLFSIAYRMLGSVAEAEDVVQEACMRWREVPEEYVGAWLPEPLGHRDNVTE
jgi:RNA polymerase sigma-70 factor (ECF subfamily)